MGKVGCLVGQDSLLVGCLGGSVITFDMSGLMKNIRVTSGFCIQVILVGSLCVSVPFTLKISCRT